MYSPDADQAAAAIARYCAPGARIALAAWTPSSFMPAMGAALAQYLPRPPAAGSPPSRWGDPSAVTDLLSQHAMTTTRTQTGSLTLRFADRSAVVDFLIRTAGHIVVEQPRLEHDGSWDDLTRTLTQLVASNDHETGDASELRLEYLTLLARRAP
jgi:hypothetical protein